MSSTFVETDHPRDTAGRFDEKPQSAPEVTLAPEAAPGRGVHLNVIGNRDERIKAMHTELEDAVAGLATDEGWLSYLDAMRKFRSYSLNNQLLIEIQHPGATKVASFKLWKELGRSPKKGEKGIAIFAPMAVNEKDDAGKPKLDANGRPIKRVIGFTAASVFDISQTEGDPLPESEWERELTEDAPAGFADDLTTAIVKAGYEVRYETDLPGGARGYTAAEGGKRVVIDANASPAIQATTLAHELGHIMCGHMDPERKGEYHTGHGGRRGDMELEAESYAYVLSRANGMQAHLRGAAEYVAGWQTRAQDDLRKTGETVAKAIKKTLTDTAWQNIDD